MKSLGFVFVGHYSLLREAVSLLSGGLEMIRRFVEDDMEAVLDIWLRASVKAHAFIDRDFWESRVGDMRDTYLPMAENHVFERDARVIGFYSLYENTLAALFVAPEHQGGGVGTVLIEHAQGRRAELDLTVYKENRASVAFYLSHGFSVAEERPDAHTGHPEYLMRLGAR